MAGVISILPKHQFSFAGEPLSNGTLNTYAAGTVTPATTWQDKALTIANANPIVLNAQGEADIWLQSGLYYKFLLKDQLGATIWTVDNVSGATDAVPVISEWSVTALPPTFISTTSFSLIGDQTATYSNNRRIRATVSGGFRYGYILSSVFSTVTTVTVILDSSTLDASLSAVDVGVISYQNSSIFEGVLPTRDLSAYAGSDLQLAVGQQVYYDVAIVAAGTQLLRLATGDNQEYTLSWRGTNAAAGANGGQVTLKPNNAVTPVANCSNFIKAQFATTDNNTVTTAQNILLLNIGGTPYQADLKVCTKTIAKAVKGQVLDANVTNGSLHGVITSTWNDTTTVWASLGTLTFPVAFTGRIMVRRDF